MCSLNVLSMKVCVCVCVYVFKDFDQDGMAEDLKLMLSSLGPKEHEVVQCEIESIVCSCLCLSQFHLLMMLVFVSIPGIAPRRLRTSQSKDVGKEKKAILLLIASRSGGSMSCLCLRCIAV